MSKIWQQKEKSQETTSVPYPDSFLNFEAEEETSGDVDPRSEVTAGQITQIFCLKLLH